MALRASRLHTLAHPPVESPRDEARVKADHTSANTLMGVLHTADFYLDPYQPTRALARRVPSPPSALWVKRGESVSRSRSHGPASELPRSVGSPSTQANRFIEIAPSIVGHDEAGFKQDGNALLFRHPEQRDVRPDTQHEGGNVVPSLLVRQA